MTWVNVGEVAYIVERQWGKGQLHQMLAALEIVPVGRELALTAAHVKAEHPLAYADAFAAALAAKAEATLVTGDPESRLLEDNPHPLATPGQVGCSALQLSGFGDRGMR